MTLSDAKSLAVFALPWVWAEPPTLYRQAVTVPDETDAGIESRDALLAAPRLGVKFAVENAEGFQEARRLERFLRNNLGQRVVVPLWTEAVPIDSVSGDTVHVSRPTTNRLFGVNRFAILWRSAVDYELIELSSVLTNALVATEEILGNFGSGDRVAPVMITEPLTAEMALDWEASYWTKGGLDFWEDPTEAGDVGFGFADVPTVGGIALWPLPLAWSGGLRIAYDRRLVIEAADSLVSRATTLGDPRASLRAALALDNRELIARALDLFDALDGRRAPLWFPTGKRDFVIVNSGVNTTTLDVEPTGYVANEWAARQSADDYSRVFILIQRGSGLSAATGTWHARRIVNAVTLENGLERLTLNGAITADAAAHVSFLLLGRLGFDDLALEFEDCDHAAASIEFRELPGEYAAHYNLAAVNGNINTDGVLTT